MRTKKSLTVGIVGCGEVAQEHLGIWRKMSNARVAAVCDSNELRARETAKVWKIPSYYSDLDGMLSRQDISIVDICAPPQAHCPIILKALDAGCHVIVEKPLTMSTEEARTILSNHKRSKAKATVIHNWLYVPAMVKALSIIRKGRLGTVIGVEVKALSPPSDPMLRDKDHWCHSIAGGRLGEMLAHPIYIMQAILGPLKVHSVQAMKLGGYPWVSFDELRVVLKANKGSASIYASFNSPRCDVLIDIYGTKGILRIDLVSDTLVQLKYRPLAILSKGKDSLQQAYQLAYSIARGAFSRISGKWTGGPELCLRAFLDSVLNDKEPLVSLKEAYDTVELLEQVCEELTQLPKG